MILVGSGGFAEEVCFWLGADISQLEGYIGKSENPRIQADFLGTVEDFKVKAGQLMLMAIGVPEFRKATAEMLCAKGVKFQTFVHPTSQIADSVTIGEGSVIGPFCVVSVQTKLGRFCLINGYGSVGHHVVVDDHCTIGPYAAVTGNCHLEDFVQLGVHASVLPKVRLRKGTKVAPGSAAYRSTRENSTVMGVPGKILEGI